jgi:hypothetical protein|tara:strand:- start:1110 stop:1994 length:885 start_codon:yes stop_codon:yes gene_type:complete
MAEGIKQEWQTYIGGSCFKSKYTITSYKNAHRRLTDYLGVAIKDSTQKDIIEAIDDIANNPNTKASLLNCGIIFYNLSGMDNKTLLKHKLIITEEINKHRCEKAKQKIKLLPSKDELDNRLKKLFIEERWADYIILWLMINYNTRNADVNVEIVNSIHQTKQDKTRNYLVRRKEDFVYIRNSYKTKRTYGQKRHCFKSIHMDRAVRYFINEMPPNLPLHVIHNNGERMDDLSLTNKIKQISGGLTESDINKIQVSVIEDLADYNALKTMADRRGTDADTLINHYNLKFQTKDLI